MRFLIRADASDEIGSGHVMRTLALAQELKRQGHTVSFLHDCPQTLRDRLHSHGFESKRLGARPGSLDDSLTTIRRALDAEAEWVIADGYAFSSTYQLSVQKAGIRVLIVDDNGDADGYPADLVLNQSLHADASLYTDWYDTQRFLLGPRYALFREEFRAWEGWKREVPKVPRRLLLSLGGLPNVGWLATVLEGVSSIGLDILVAGGIPPQSHGTLGRFDSVEFLAETGSMADVIVRCDIGLTAGGGTTREFLYLGLPFVVVDVAPNQVLQSRFLEEQRLAVRVGSIDSLDSSDLNDAVRTLARDSSERIRMSRAGQERVDALGVDRVVCRLVE